VSLDLKRECCRQGRECLAWQANPPGLRGRVVKAAAGPVPWRKASALALRLFDAQGDWTGYGEEIKIQ